jgi:peptide/nickel transport system substrate-binding protein
LLIQRSDLKGGGMKLRLAVTLAATTAALLAAGCSSSPAGQSAPSSEIPLLRVGTTQAGNSVDPTNPDSSNIVTQLGLETLLTFGPRGQLEPSLATSWAQTSPVTWVYHLRHGVRFWDGHLLTAADVAYSLNYDRAPASAGAYAFTSVKGVTASGPYTVVVTLTQPDASWQYVPAEFNAEIFEKSFALAHKGTMGRPGVLIEGTGPWQIDSLDPTTGAQLSANPHWWGGRVPIRRISVVFFASETSEALAFRAGEIDLDPYVVDPRSFAATSGAKLLSAPDCASGLFSMNTQVAPWNDVHVRRAVAYALDRPAIIAANGGYVSPNYTLIPAQLLRTIASPSQVSSLLQSLPSYPYSVGKARQEMAESRYPHGFTTTLQEYTGMGQIINESQVIAAELRQIGINVQVKSNSLNAWAALATGPVDQRPTSLFYSGCTAPDPSNYNYVLGSWNLKPGQWNTAGYAPADVDTLINASVATTDPARRFAVYSKLLQQLATDVPYVPLYVTDLSIALSSKFTYSGLSAFSLQNGPYALNIKLRSN